MTDKQYVDLVTGVQSRLMTVTVRGTGSNIGLDVTAANRTNGSYWAYVDAGTLFRPSNSGIQTMVATREEMVGELAPKGTTQARINAMCVNAFLDPPSPHDTLSVSTDACGEELQTLFRDIFIYQKHVDSSVLQQAVWSISEALTSDSFFEKFVHPRLDRYLAFFASLPKRDQKSLRRRLVSAVDRLLAFQAKLDEVSGKSMDQLEYFKIEQELARLRQSAEELPPGLTGPMAEQAFRFMGGHLPPRFFRYPPFSKRAKFVALARRKHDELAKQVQEVLTSCGIQRQYT